MDTNVSGVLSEWDTPIYTLLSRCFVDLVYEPSLVYYIQSPGQILVTMVLLRNHLQTQLLATLMVDLILNCVSNIATS